MITVVGPFVRVRRASIYRPNSYERVQLHLSDVTRLNSFDFLWLKCLYKIKISSLISNFFVILAYVYLLFIKWTVSVITAINVSTVELHLSGLIWTASHRDMQNIQRIGFFLKKKSHIGSLNFACYCLQHVPASKPLDRAWFAVLEAITLYCTWSDNRQFQGKVVL